jgi:hypothetical protein
VINARNNRHPDSQSFDREGVEIDNLIIHENEVLGVIETPGIAALDDGDAQRDMGSIIVRIDADEFKSYKRICIVADDILLGDGGRVIIAALPQAGSPDYRSSVSKIRIQLAVQSNKSIRRRDKRVIAHDSADPYTAL